MWAAEREIWPDIIWVVCVLTNLVWGLMFLSCLRSQTCYMAWCHPGCLCAYKLATGPDVIWTVCVLTNLLHSLMSLSCLCLQTHYMAWCLWVVCMFTNLLHGLMSPELSVCLQTLYMAWYLWVVRAYKLALWPDIIWAVCVLTNLLLFEHQQKMEAYGVTSYGSSWKKDVTNWCLQFGLSLHCCYHPTLTQCSCSSV